jgi:protein-S-isoprenylcysteine O-methyltransferase Ste14
MAASSSTEGANRSVGRLVGFEPGEKTPSGEAAVVRRGVIRFILREYFGVLFIALLLRWTSGRWDWAAGWALVALYFTWVTATVLVLAPTSPALLAERAQRTHQNTKSWDKVILALFGLETLARYVVAGFDVRYGWSPDFSLAPRVIGAVLCALGFALVLWSMAANPWFSHVVRMQNDRSQQVAMRGPYALVRHPGYLGTFGFEVGSGLLLGSWPAVALGLLGVVLFTVRTALEDRALLAELAGYEAYAKRVRYRLIPGLW